MIRPKRSLTKPSPSSLPWIWGTHPVLAALNNPERICHTVMGTSDALRACSKVLSLHPHLPVREVSRENLEKLLPPYALHQGIAVQVSPLPLRFLDPFLKESPHIKRLVILDQITDPHNFGAIIRSACAFQMDAILLTPRHSPPLEGVVAKSASGALEKIPLICMTNLAHNLEILKKEGFWCIGLTERGTSSLEKLPPLERIALVLGAEGKGLRPLTIERCDFLTSLPTNPDFPTLNVSNAAACALYHFSSVVLQQEILVPRS